MAVDTLSIAQDLRDAKFTSAQAEALATVIGRAGNDSADGLSTKADIANLELKLQASESHLEAKIEAVQSKLVMWFVGTQIAFVAILGAMIKF